MTYIELINTIKTKKQNSNAPLVISIDGRCGSGKSTLASELARVLNAELIHADDFFLPLNLRTSERLNEAGGNFHYERFCKEVIPFLKSGEVFAFKRFDCSKMELGEFCQIKNADYIIIEGSYSQHPKLPAYADIKLFLTIDKNTQMQRILKRSGAEKAKMFETKWIPLEEAYFSAYQIEHKADFIFNKSFDFNV